VNLTIDYTSQLSGTFLHVDCYRIDDWIWLDGTPAIDASLPRDQSGRLPAVPDGHDRAQTLYALARLGLVDNQSSIVYQWHLTTNESTLISPICISKNFTYSNCTDNTTGTSAQQHLPLTRLNHLTCSPGHYLVGSNYSRISYNLTCSWNGSLSVQPWNAVCQRYPVCPAASLDSVLPPTVVVQVQLPAQVQSPARAGVEHPLGTKASAGCLSGECMSEFNTTTRLDLMECTDSGLIDDNDNAGNDTTDGNATAMGGSWRWIGPGDQAAASSLMCFKPSCYGSDIQSLIDQLRNTRNASITLGYNMHNASFDAQFLQLVTLHPELSNVSNVRFPAGGNVTFSCKPPYFRNSTAGKDRAVCTCAGWDINAWEFSCDEHCPTTHTGLGSNSCHSGKYYSSENSTEKKYQPVGQCNITCHPHWMLNRQLAAENLHQQVLMAGNETRDIVLDCLTNRTLVGIPSGFNPQTVCEKKPCTNSSLTVPEGAELVGRNYSELYEDGDKLQFKCSPTFQCSDSVYIIKKCNSGPSDWKIVSIRESCANPSTCQLRDNHNYDSSISQVTPPVCIQCGKFTFENVSLNSVVQLGQSIDYKCVHDKYQNHTGTMRCKCDGFHNVTDINFVCEP
uniref:Sushi domain-containing protein n=1 Tax=Macrostomum lignano TaxID=282301 RepID=A0A1I8GRH4_9PLAT